jgi:DNA repair exonuclease SbcCD ATPase subunit
MQASALDRQSSGISNLSMARKSKSTRGSGLTSMEKQKINDMTEKVEQISGVQKKIEQKLRLLVLDEFKAQLKAHDEEIRLKLNKEDFDAELAKLLEDIASLKKSSQNLETATERNQRRNDDRIDKQIEEGVKRAEEIKSLGREIEAIIKSAKNARLKASVRDKLEKANNIEMQNRDDRGSSLALG